MPAATNNRAPTGAGQPSNDNRGDANDGIMEGESGGKEEEDEPNCPVQ